MANSNNTTTTTTNGSDAPSSDDKNKSIVIDPTIENQVNDLMVSDPDLIQEDLTNTNNTRGDEEEEARRQHENNKNVTTTTTYRFVPLRMGGGGRTHVPTRESASLLLSNDDNEGITIDDLQRMTTMFYENAFQDVTLDKFIRSHNDPHGTRFALWIYQKLVPGSTVWDDDRTARNKDPVRVAGGRYAVVHDRTSAHVAAWHSPKRPSNEVGRHFTLEEGRVWMRLHFWALRSSGMIQKSPSFVDYYVRFIAHFVRVYESTAPMFARESYRWSANPANFETYVKDGRIMNDVLDLSYEEACEQLPDEEYNDFEWPYNQTPRPVLF